MSSLPPSFHPFFCLLRQRGLTGFCSRSGRRPPDFPRGWPPSDPGERGDLSIREGAGSLAPLCRTPAPFRRGQPPFQSAGDGVFWIEKGNFLSLPLSRGQALLARDWPPSNPRTNGDTLIKRGNSSCLPVLISRVSSIRGAPRWRSEVGTVL